MLLREVTNKIQASAPPKTMETRVISIDGPGGSGKTVLAERLSKVLNAQVIHTDDFFDPVVRNDWWKRLAHEVLEPLSKNQRGKYQRYDWDSKSLAEWHSVEPAEFIIVEGVQSSRKHLRDYAAFHIWVETPRDIRLQRGLKRDGEDARDEWAKWMAKEDAYISDEHPEKAADLIIDGTDSEIVE